MDFGGRNIYPDSSDDNAYNKLCMYQINETIRSFGIKMLMMYLSLLGSMMGPAYGLYVHGSRTTMTNIKIPYTEPYSLIEFTLNLILTSVIGIHGFIGYIGLEVAMALFSDVVTISPKIAELELQELNENCGKSGLKEPQLRHTFNNIIKKALDTDE